MTEPRPPAEPLAIDVRRATAADTEAVLSFTRRTWDGWDYIPRVWADWLRAPDGIVLVATARAGGAPALDRFGRGLEPDRAVAIARVTLLAEGEAWLEGMRVDPGVRGRSVATALQEACLHWALAQGATSVRYLTGETNEGSHRLAARHGFRMLQPWRSFSVPDEPGEEEAAEPVVTVSAEDEGVEVDSLETDVEPALAREILETEEELALEADDTAPTDDLEGVEGAPVGLPEALAPANVPPPGDTVTTGGGAVPAGASGRAVALATLRTRLTAAGLLLAPTAAGDRVRSWWERVAGDATFAAGDFLYEGRAWAFQPLTAERFAAHAAAGDVVVVETGTAWAAGVVCLQPLLAEDDEPFLGLLVGDGPAAAVLLGRLRDALPRMPRVRVPVSLPLFGGDPEPLLTLGLHAGDHAGHLFERSLDPAAPPAPVSAPGTLRLVEPPRRIAVPPRVGG